MQQEKRRQRAVGEGGVFLFGRDDFGDVQKRWDDFWTGKNRTPLYAVAIPKNGVEGAPGPPYLMGFNGDYQAVGDMLARWAGSREFLGDAVPSYCLSFGADDFAAFCGADLVMGESGDTSWPVRVLTTLKGSKIAFDINGKWWGRLTEFHHTLKKTLGDTVLLTPPTLTAGLDAIVGLYGAANLLMDMVDDPATVHEALEQINAAYTDITAACAELFEVKKYGSASRHGMYTSGVAGVPQCDVSCMISPAMFEEFAIPCLLHEMDGLDAVEYHLDGPDAVRHLDRLARIKKLRVVQWVPGAGEAQDRDWTDLYKRVLSLGKGLILGGNERSVKRMQREFNSKDIFYNVGGLKTRTQAEDFLADMERIWERR